MILRAAPKVFGVALFFVEAAVSAAASILQATRPFGCAQGRLCHYS